MESPLHPGARPFDDPGLPAGVHAPIDRRVRGAFDPSCRADVDNGRWRRHDGDVAYVGQRAHGIILLQEVIPQARVLWVRLKPAWGVSLVQPQRTMIPGRRANRGTYQ